jgi:hypothetical protein
MRSRTALVAVVVFVGLASVCFGKGVVAQGAFVAGAALAVAADSGDFVVVWQDVDHRDRDGNPVFGVFARLYDRNGAPKGRAFRVHDRRAGNQDSPKVAADPAGNFVVVWRGGTPAFGTNEWPGGDGDGYGVFFQRFDNSGTRLGRLTHASSILTGSQSGANVAMHSDASFEIIWQDCSQSTDCSNLRIGRFSRSGERLGEELVIPVLTFTSFGGGLNLIPTPRIAAGAKGFAAGFTEYGNCGDWWNPERFPVVLHFSDAGSPFAQRYRLDDGSCVNDNGWDLAAVIASRTGSSAAFFNAAANYRNTVQRFAPDGGTTGQRSTVGKKYACDSRSCEMVAAAAMGPDGRSAVLWDVDESTGDPQEPIEHSLQAQFFDRKGQPAGDRFGVPGAFQKGRILSAAGLDKEGTLTVVWIQTVEEAGAIREARLRVRQFRSAAKSAAD